MLKLISLLFSSSDSSNINWASLKPAAKSVQSQAHPYHLVDASPLPFLVSFALGAALCMSAFFFHDWPANDALTLATLAYAHGKPYYMIYYGVFILLLALILVWGLHVSDEATYQGFHTVAVQKGLRFGMVLFITS